MSRDQPRLIILAGPNGAGKTTASYELLKRTYQIDEFVNADTIARGLSAFSPESVAMAASRIMLKRIKELVSMRKSLAAETTLASRTLASMIRDWRAEHGYYVILYFLWLPTPEMAIERVADRVRAGGHNIPNDVVRRRFQRGIENFLTLYKDIVDEWHFVDSSNKRSLQTIAKGTMLNQDVILRPEVWSGLCSGELS
jgi:predicted ABC-type ATPase